MSPPPDQRLQAVQAAAIDYRQSRETLIEASRDAIADGADAGDVATLIMRAADSPMPLSTLIIDVEGVG